MGTSQMVTRFRALSMAFAVVLSASTVAACGSGDTDEQRAVAALKAQMVGNAGMTTGKRLDDEQTTCVAQGAVDTLGVAKLKSYELLTDDLRPGESLEGVALLPKDADVLAGVFATCLNVERLTEREIISGLDLPKKRKRKAARCVRRLVEGEDVVRTLSLEFQGAENPVFDELLTELKKCVR